MRTIVEKWLVDLIWRKWEDTERIYLDVNDGERQQKVWSGLGTIINHLLSYAAAHLDLQYPELPLSKNHLALRLRDDLPTGFYEGSTAVVWVGAIGRGTEVLRGKDIPAQWSRADAGNLLAEIFTPLFEEVARPAVAGIITPTTVLTYMDDAVRKSAVPESIIIAAIKHTHDPQWIIRSTLAPLGTNHSID